MGRKVEKLSAALQNQIAAGEVVERPASVVKELLENALDAGAKKIRIDVEQGGLALLRVIDDGEGMAPDDAERALERHATSKLREFDDLMHLASFGFRGEALPSIASVSRFSLVTRTSETAQAIRLSVEGGGPITSTPTGAAIGTTIEVADLFYNVPARRKFLKTIATENTHIAEVVMLAALSAPLVAIELVRDGKSVRNYQRSSNRGERARELLVGEKLHDACFTRGPLTVEAFVGAPERARAGTTALHLIVNGRPIRDRALARAVAQAYGSTIESGRYPIGVVYIDLSPELVDVNVHPQKIEVRFADGRAVFDGVARGLAEHLAALFRDPNADGSQSPSNYSATLARALGASKPSWSPQPSGVREQVALHPGVASGGALRSEPQREADATPERAWPQQSANAHAGTPAVQQGRNDVPRNDGAHAADEASLFRSVRFYAGLRFVGQLRRMFLLCEGKDALYIIDQHAAAERVTFDRLRRSFAAKRVATQQLLVPALIEIAPTELARLDEFESEFEAFGLDVRRSGSSAISVHAVPQLVAKVDPEVLVRDLLAELTRAGGRLFSERSDLVLATMACHGSVRSGDLVAAEAAAALLCALDEVDFASHCPHGRPVLHRMAFSDLEQKVGR